MGRISLRLRVGVGILFTFTSVQGDTVVKVVIEGDDIALPRKADRGRCAVAATDAKPGDIVTLYANCTRARRDRNDLTVLLRTDRHKLFLVYHQSKRFTEFPLPVKYDRYFQSGPGRNYDDMKRFNIVARMDPVQVSANGSPAWELGFTVMNGLRDQYRVRVVMSDARAIDAPLLMELQRVLNNMKNRGFGWVDALSLPKGMPMI